ncbi:MAG TPA: group 1 truncated hemoglobin [Trebonia sp.]
MAGAAESLYEAIGGESALVWVMDDFYVRVLADPDLSGIFAGTSMPKLKGRQVAFLAAALGGPDLYRGNSMRKAHAGRRISQADFDRVAVHLAAALAAAGVPAGTVRQVVETIAPLAADIVSPGLS